jgi:mono/diheme cytochrome c family protein
MLAGTNSPYTVSPFPAGNPVAGFTPVPDALKWDSKSKEYSPVKGLQSQDFSFMLTNVWTNEVTIRSAHTSCGCTVAQLPSTPWILKPNEGGELKGSVNLAGKFGSITKSVTLDTSVGPQVVAIRVNIPTPDVAAMREGDRSRNLQVASADRQAVFRGDCASCHVSPTVGKLGADLYDKACGICHEGPTRASMVPDLHKLNKPTNHDYWTAWISQGKAGSLMPAFALASGGILDQKQINSIADYLTSAAFTNAPAKPATAVLPPPTGNKPTL